MSVQFFGQFLLARGLISGEKLIEAVRLQEQTNVKLGDVAVQLELMTRDDAERINRLQRIEDQRFGDLAIREGVLTQPQFEQVLGEQSRTRLFLGEALVKCGALTDRQLETELLDFAAEQDQMQIPATLAGLFAGRPHARTLEVCTDVVLKMLTRVAHLTVKASACHDGAAAARPADYTVSQSFSGGFRGLVGLNISTPILLHLAGKLLEEQLSEVGDDALDGASEFLNIAAGNICAKLSQEGSATEIQPPTVCDNGSAERFDLEGVGVGCHVTVVDLLHPDHLIQLYVVDKDAS